MAPTESPYEWRHSGTWMSWKKNMVLMSSQAKTRKSDTGALVTVP